MSASFALSKRASARSIAVIGGGASGALIAAHLLKCADDDVHLTLTSGPSPGRDRANCANGTAVAGEACGVPALASREGAE
jgi:cation diffusion facilitator CzcD-associated flavoprotein CzcO